MTEKPLIFALSEKKESSESSVKPGTSCSNSYSAFEFQEIPFSRPRMKNDFFTLVVPQSREFTTEKNDCIPRRPSGKGPSLYEISTEVFLQRVTGLRP